MIELELSKIKVDDTKNEQIIIFKEKQGTRFLPVVIGMAEINSIKLKLSGIQPPRPLTHDLFIQTIGQLDVKLDRVVIDRLHQNTFYAKLFLKKTSNGQAPIVIDARPSDSVALALRAEAPVFVAEEVMGHAGVNEI